MKKVIFGILTGILCVLVMGRALLPQSARAAGEVLRSGADYNILDIDLPVVRQTAGSALLAEMNAYYIFRMPTAKNEYTGILAGKDLVVICGDNWAPGDVTDRSASPALNRLWTEGAHISDVYRPDWYQGSEGREFALLSGLMPTSVRDTSSFLWCGRQDIYLPFALPRGLADAGYTCTALCRNGAYTAAYEALGFSCVRAEPEDNVSALERELSAGDGEGPLFVYCVWDDTDGEEALSELLGWLDRNGRTEDTVICLYTTNTQEFRGHLFLWGEGLAEAESTLPCSDLDVTPTLLNLFGIDYDSRFLSGRDIFAGNGTGAKPNAATPLVSLGGSAYADWVTDAGSYIASEDMFFPAGAALTGQREEALGSYAEAVSALVYDRYVYARRILENNYFRLVFP